jgi:hypothetical protein
MAVTIELSRELSSRVEGLQVTSVHGSSQTAEALLTALRPRSARGGTLPGAMNG